MNRKWLNCFLLRARGEVRVEFGMLFGLVAILSFFAAPLFTGSGSLTPTAANLNAGNQGQMQLAMQGGAKAPGGHSAGKHGQPLETANVLVDSASGHGTNATSTEGMKMAEASAVSANELGNIARQFQGGAGADPALSNMLTRLANQGSTLAKTQKSLAGGGRSGAQSSQLASLKQSEAGFHRQLEQLIVYLSTHPEALTPELQQQIVQQASEILSMSAAFQGKSILSEQDTAKIQQAYNQCVNRDDMEQCLQQALQ